LCAYGCIQEDTQTSKERKGAARPERAAQRDARVEELLQACGLDEWGPCFARERIDYSGMLELEMSDLVSLGMPLGHRKLLLKAVRLASSASEQAPPAHALEHPAPPSLAVQKDKKKNKAARRVPGAAGTAQGGQAHQAHSAEADDALLEADEEAQPTAEEEERTPEEEECTSMEAAADGTRVGVRKGRTSLQEKRVAKMAAQAAKKAAKLGTRAPCQNADSDNAETADAKQQKALDAFSVSQVSSNPYACTRVPAP
jgi:hypothetical protein